VTLGILVRGRRQEPGTGQGCPKVPQAETQSAAEEPAARWLVSIFGQKIGFLSRASFFPL